jgi:hypothetical protein
VLALGELPPGLDDDADPPDGEASPPSEVEPPDAGELSWTVPPDEVPVPAAGDVPVEDLDAVDVSWVGVLAAPPVPVAHWVEPSLSHEGG